MKKHLFTVSRGDPERLSALLSSRGIAIDLIASGAVRVNGQRVLDDAPLVVGAKITVFEAPIETAAQIQVQFRDEWLLVVEKPAGLPTQATPTSSHALDALVFASLAKDAKLMHRLDREASGLVLFAPSAPAAPALQKLLENGAIHRRYVARVAGTVAGEGTIRLRIGRHPTDVRLRQALSETATEGQAATSYYKVITNETSSTLVSLTLESGRTHQLRVHLAAIGHPIWGDRAYGGPAADRLHLHSTELSLPHPSHRRPVVVESPSPFLTSEPR